MKGERLVLCCLTIVLPQVAWGGDGEEAAVREQAEHRLLGPGMAQLTCECALVTRPSLS